MTGTFFSKKVWKIVQHTFLVAKNLLSQPWNLLPERKKTKTSYKFFLKEKKITSKFEVFIVNILQRNIGVFYFYWYMSAMTMKSLIFWRNYFSVDKFHDFYMFWLSAKFPRVLSDAKNYVGEFLSFQKKYFLYSLNSPKQC